MGFSHFFIDRPIFATVLSVIITLLGAVAYFTLPVAQYPEIAPPTIQVTATYPGASAEVVADTVATPIEQEINGVENMLYMVSQSTGDGRLTITITFNLGTDLDQAQVLVQNRVAIAEPRLPEEVRRLGIVTQKSSPDLMMVIHMFSDDGSRDQLYVSNYARTQVVDRLARIEGVGQARLFAERAYSMRIWLDPELIASKNMTAGEVVQALRVNNTQVASGVINQQPVSNPSAYEIAVETQGRLIDPEEFENIVVRTFEDGAQVRVRDIGRVELGALDYTTIGYLDDKSALPILIFQRPGSNALETASELLATMDELSQSFPSGVAFDVIYNPTEFIEQSVNAVYQTLFEAMLLVVLVIIFFLQSIRAAIIPVIAIPISLIGTFAVMAAFGFSLNNLTLFGLVLAIGIVVDDAIVVVENVERYLREGETPKNAARKTMTEVSGALIATSLVMMAVFIPASFVTGISGQFFRQFALTIAVATAISTLVSLTLSPALAALLLRRDEDGEKRGVLGTISYILGFPLRIFSKGFNFVFDGLSAGYAFLVRGLVRVAIVVLALYGGLIYLGLDLFERTPTGFIPDQNQGYLITVIQLPPGSSLTRTDEVVKRATKIILDHPGTAHTAGFAGFNGATFTNAPNAGAIFFTFKDFDELLEMGLTQQDILQQVQGSLFQIKEAFIFVIAPPPVRGIGSAGGWKLYVQDRRGRGLPALEQATQQMVGAGNQTEGLAQVFTQFNTATPRIYADIDRVKAEQLGVTPDQIFETLETYLGSVFINDFNFLGRTFRVTAQADGEYRDEPRDVENLRTRTAGGGMMPIGSVATFEQITGPYRIARYNLFPAAAVQGAATPGTSTGEALAKMEENLENLPSGFDFEWTELALQEKNSGDTTLILFAMAIVFVFLVLAAQYESWLLPLSVILIVPMCLLAAISGVLFRGMDNNILTQIGLVVLVGLASKNAILIVEFAKQAEDEGMSRVEAAVQAARLRLRPILMTSFAFIFGVIPLVTATGAGSEMRQVLGTTVFAGMIGVTFFGLLFTPVFYVLCRWLAAPFAGFRKKKAEPAA
ncbi:MAG: multidrug efflux RND transporter permease subunit [Pseudomonadota bacterium]